MEPQADPGQAAPKKKKTIVWIVLSALVAGMCCVCSGIFAAAGIPAFLSYMQRSKEAEAETMLRQIFDGTASYFDEVHAGPDGQPLRGCFVEDAEMRVPDAARHNVEVPASFRVARLSPGPYYFQYRIETGGSRCGVGTGESYAIHAIADLNGDGVPLRMTIRAFVDEGGYVYRAPGIERDPPRPGAPRGGM